MDGADQLGASHDPAVTLLVCPASLPEAASVPCCNKFSFMRICNNDKYVILLQILMTDNSLHFGQ